MIDSTQPRKENIDQCSVWRARKRPVNFLYPSQSPAKAMRNDIVCSCRLSLCEKALAEYLETKRLAFPRFYFVSSADLLDILSKGNQPIEVSF